MPEIAPTDLSEPALARVAALLCEVFPNAAPIDAAYLHWAYAANPMGTAICCDARDAGALVAHLGGRALEARVEGAPARGLLIHHAATRASQRGRGLFGALLEAIARAGQGAGYDFLIAVANAQSAPIFVAQHGFQALGALDVSLGLGLPPQPIGAAPAHFEAVLGERALAWRLARPGADYRVRRAGEELQLLAPTGRLGAWVELGWIPLAAAPAGLPVLASAPRLGARIGLDPRPRARAWPALRVPLRLRPSPLELVFRDLRGVRRLDRARTAFRVLDFDAY